MLRDLVVTTLRSLWGNKFRFGLTALGIVWGAAMLTYLSAMADGYDKHFEVQLDKLGQRIVFLFPGVATKHHVGQRGARAVELEREDIERIAALEAVERAAPNVWLGPRVMRATGKTKLVYTYGGSEETAALRNFEIADGRFLSRRDVVRQYEATGGKVGHDWNCTSCLILHTTGRKSGATRKFPLIFGRDGEDYVIVASKGGAPENPGWYENLLAHPDAKIQVWGEVIPVTARTGTATDKKRVWPVMTAQWPDYDGYQAKTPRDIPVVLLRRR